MALTLSEVLAYRRQLGIRPEDIGELDAVDPKPRRHHNQHTKGILSDDQIGRIHALRSEGWSLSRLGIKFGVSKTTVRRVLGLITDQRRYADRYDSEDGETA